MLSCLYMVLIGEKGNFTDKQAILPDEANLQVQAA